MAKAKWKKKTKSLRTRPRRLRKSSAIREIVKETSLRPEQFIWPLFVTEGKNQKIAVNAMPGVHRLSKDLIIKAASEAWDLGIRAIALFPHIEENKKDEFATESKNPKGLLQLTVQELKKNIPELCVITDVAMDPYSTSGHDGFVKDGEILNDETLVILTDMALCQAQAGADFVAPSDMMDGRVGHIRDALDEAGFKNVGIISYSAKYASSFYGPFRDALDSAPKFGDKKTYQMNPANRKEAVREALLDISEGADIVMVKPALSYLDIISDIKSAVTVPVAAYNVSGEYAMIKTMAEKGLLDHDRALLEVLGSIHRAGADLIFTYHAMEAALLLNK